MADIRPHDAFEALVLDGTARVFILTGAGISAESGLPTFRDANGLWEKHRVEDVASPEGWRADPALVWRFYSQRRQQAAPVRPNAAHHALANLEARLGDRLFLCTQNVDPLHERAGSKRVVHMHGELMKSRCEANHGRGREHAEPFADENTYLDGNALPRCACGGKLRPHICWFGEIPFFMDEIQDALLRANVFVTIGSSGAVYPAAGFVRAARQQGARCIYVGPEAPDNASAFDECRLGTATRAVPSLFG